MEFVHSDLDGVKSFIRADVIYCRLAAPALTAHNTLCRVTICVFGWRSEDSCQRMDVTKKGDLIQNSICHSGIFSTDSSPNLSLALTLTQHLTQPNPDPSNLNPNPLSCHSHTLP